MNYFRSLFSFLFWMGASIIALICLYKVYDYFRSERLLEEEMHRVAAKHDCTYLGRPWGTNNIALFNCDNKVLADIISPEPLKELYPTGYKKKGQK